MEPNFAVSNNSSNSNGFLLWPLLVIVVILVIIMIIYHQTIGYYINYGWNNIWNLIYKKEDVEVSVGSEEAPIVEAKFKKYEEPPAAEVSKSEEIIKQIFQPPPPPPQPEVEEQQPSFLPNHSKRSVYNISNNDYTYYDAPAVCKAFGGELATYEQVKEAHKKGADWCNYGWVKGQQAVYPTQESTWKKLQKGAPEFAKSCGKPGVNGGHFDNPELRFGVNCYGPRPPKKALDEELESQVALPPSTEEIEFDKRVQHYRDNINSIGVSPFNKSKR